MAERNLGIVDLRKLKENALALKTKANAKLLAVIKANAYGHGAERVANALHGEVDGFCVAIAEEGISLRYAGVSLPVLVFSPPLNSEEAEKCIRHELTMTVDGALSLKRILTAAKLLQKPAYVHCKVETGMHRLGMEGEELRQVFAAANAHPLIRVTGAYTHFSCVADAEYTKGQYERFLRLTAPLKAVNPNLLLHAGATGAIRYGNRFSLDAVRPGIGLYGYGIEGVSPILSLSAPILKRGKASAGERLGYGAPLSAPYAYAVARHGYADGAFRKGEGITPRCMDVSFLPFTKQDSVEIIGPNRSAEQIAKEEGTVPYEILVKYTSRARLFYLN
ncbi:MAG: alanine racemase [Clostridia bacterium]|nr:alanine racemase [Clostridia bacterium]